MSLHCVVVVVGGQGGFQVPVPANGARGPARTTSGNLIWAPNRAEPERHQAHPEGPRRRRLTHRTGQSPQRCCLGDPENQREDPGETTA
jgi:hypothetical protein